MDEDSLLLPTTTDRERRMLLGFKSDLKLTQMEQQYRERAASKAFNSPALQGVLENLVKDIQAEQAVRKQSRGNAAPPTPVAPPAKGAAAAGAPPNSGEIDHLNVTFEVALRRARAIPFGQSNADLFAGTFKTVTEDKDQQAVERAAYNLARRVELAQRIAQGKFADVLQNLATASASIAANAIFVAAGGGQQNQKSGLGPGTVPAAEPPSGTPQQQRPMPGLGPSTPGAVVGGPAVPNPQQQQGSGRPGGLPAGKLPPAKPGVPGGPRPPAPGIGFPDEMFARNPPDP